MGPEYNKIIDEYQNVHIQDKILGQGGQGIVFRTKDPDLAIKIITDNTGEPIRDNNIIEKYQKRFKRVRLLPLPERCNVSVPVALLDNHAGYVMQLLSEMVPFSFFWIDGKTAESISKKDIPFWLSEMPDSDAKKIVYYCKTGGLRRRLIALFKSASILARLHGNGLVYGDISPNNIFISRKTEDSSVWLIDADNIRFEVTSGGSAVYTPKYGAPELVQGLDSGRPASDCHAFAVIAFYLLSLIHPYVGKKVDGTDDADWADDKSIIEDIEEKAYAGQLPWVDDQTDDSNSSESGLPRSLILTEKLKILFEETFSAGRTSFWRRPAIYHWPESLAQAADLTIKCHECAMTYYYDFLHPEIGEHNCPYCNAYRPRMLMLKSYRWNGCDMELVEPYWQFVREVEINSDIRIPQRVLGSFSMAESDSEEIIISILKESILVKRLETFKSDLFVAREGHQDNCFKKVYTQVKIECKSENYSFWMFVDIDKPTLIHCSISGGEK